MSDPIRSISQNNFILADQKEVSHDNTLSGKGTPESPLGLNETVLWSGNATSATLSEPYTSFQYIEVYFYHHGPGYTKIPTDLMNDSVSYPLCTTPTFTNSYGSIYLQSYYTPTTTEFEKQYICKEFYGNTGNISAGNPSSDIMIRKIVGIKRIANN